MGRILSAACGILGLALAAAPVEAKRYALVIGINDYAGISDLNNAVRDATDFAALLKSHNIEVDEYYDASATASGLRDALDTLEAKIGPDDEVIVYYSGHGMSLGKGDILAPTDVEIDCEFKTAKRAIKIDDVAAKISLARRKIVLIDACRDNPVPAACPATKGGTRSAGFRGLKLIDTKADGLLLASSTHLATRASDGAIGGNSPFAAALLKRLTETPGKPWPLLINEVGGDVANATEFEQVPEIVTRGSTADTCLRGEACGLEVPAVVPKVEEEKPVEPPAVVAAPVADPAAAAWSIAENSNSRDMLEAIVRRFPETVYADFAKAKLKAMEQEVAVVVPAEPAPAPTPAGCDGLVVSVGPKAKSKDDCLKPGDVFRDLADGPEMVVLPAGRFTMGSPESEEGRNDDEGPQHEVRITKAFAVGKFEVTRGQFAAFVNATGYDAGNSCYTWSGSEWKAIAGKTWKDVGFKQTDNHPVACVKWEDAKAYVAWLAKETGKTYRLLSEAEWEYTARAGTTTPFSTGATISTEQANYDGNYTYGSGNKGLFREKTVEVGSLRSPSPFGLNDMHGNVWEWTEDCYIGSYKDGPDTEAARTTESCEIRVLRGGSWGNNPRILRSAIRLGTQQDLRGVFIGFRLARTL